MDPRDVIRTKRDGGRLSSDEIRSFLNGYVAGDVEDFHASALLMGVFCNGLEPEELQDWTRAMLESGSKLEWKGIDGPVLDKHSTGGVGDKVSLPLAPALVALGGYVPMISGRGLGHTGGTLDKLEAVPGLKTELSLERLNTLVREVGMFIAAQTPELVPADRKLYALRDASGLVESIPLIASSIMSKKLAEGLNALVLDVKFGSGAFLGDIQDGRRLAQAMADIASGFGLALTVVTSSMEEPLGRTVGHAMEINECLDVLRGNGPQDLVDLTVHLGAEALQAVGLTKDVAFGEAAMRGVLQDGRALDVFMRVLAAQGGDLSFGESLPETGQEDWLLADHDGFLACVDCRLVGLALMELGGARRVIGGKIDTQVGIELHSKHGAKLSAGDPIARIVHRDGKGLELARKRLLGAFQVQDEPPKAVGATTTLVL